jgi:hypothetical protein
MRAVAMLQAEQQIGRTKALRAALRDARGIKAPKRRKKRRKSRGGKMPLGLLIKRYDKLGRVLRARGFKE